MYNKRRIAKTIIDLSYQLKRDLEQAAAQHGLTRTQAVIIRYLEVETTKRDIFQKDIEKEFRIRKSSVTSVLQLLEKNEYITRENVIREDARLKKLVLTDKARKVNAIIGDGMEKREEKFYQVLTTEEVESFFQAMEKLSRILE